MVTIAEHSRTKNYLCGCVYVWCSCVYVWCSCLSVCYCVCVAVCMCGAAVSVRVLLCVCVSLSLLLCMCGCVYVWCSYEDSDSVEVTSRHIRPRARHKLCLADISVGSRVLVNYNYDEPNGRGYWYDAVVSGKHVTRTVKRLTATVFIG